MDCNNLLNRVMQLIRMRNKMTINFVALINDT